MKTLSFNVLAVLADKAGNITSWLEAHTSQLPKHVEIDYQRNKCRDTKIDPID